MLRKNYASWFLAALLVVLSATSASAFYFKPTISGTATLACTNASLVVSGALLVPGQDFIVNYTITLNGPNSPGSFSGSIHPTADEFGKFNQTVTFPITGRLNGTYTQSGTVKLYEMGQLMGSNQIQFTANTMYCPLACINTTEQLSMDGGKTYIAAGTCSNAPLATSDTATYKVTVSNCGNDIVDDVTISDDQGLFSHNVNKLLVGQTVTYTSSSGIPLWSQTGNFSDTVTATGVGHVSGSYVQAQDSACVTCGITGVTVAPTFLFPMAITKAVVDQINTANGTYCTVGSTIKIGSSYHYPTSAAGQWTSFDVVANDVPTIRNLIANGNPSPLNIGDPLNIWIEPGTKNTVYGDVPVGATVALPVVDSLDTHSYVTLLGVIDFHITASVGGNGKYVQGYFTGPKYPPNL